MFNMFGNSFGSPVMGNQRNMQQRPMQQINNPFASIMQIGKQFQEFKSNFQGDPAQKLDEELKARNLSQEQIGQLEQAVNMFKGILGGK